MTLSFTRSLAPTTRRHPRSTRPSFRPSLDALEGRLVLSATMTAPAPTIPPPAQVAQSAATSILPINISSITISSLTRNANGTVTATGTLVGTLLNQAITLPVTLTSSPSTSAPNVSILDLDLAPIHLNVLGLKVDTSEICLDITAQPGSGNLLGNLLGDVANLLNGGKTNNGVLNKLNKDLANANLLSGVTTLLNDVTSLLTPTALPTAGPAGTTLLNLSVGPVDLNLLGLNVHLDNCANGPVTVALTAVPGPGNLLGNLLGDVANLLNNQTLPLSITGVTAQNGQLLATGTVGSQSFSTPLTLAVNPASTASVPILDLHLDAIHLNVLGLKVDTSNICLDVTAIPGQGNLLGNLLAGIANALNQGSSLSTILGNLSASDLSTLTTGLTGLLNGALTSTPLTPAAASAPAAAPGTTNVLSLVLGPLNLNVLGLDVHLDNCANGPVTVDISAVSGPGNLLGNLVTDLVNLLNR